MFVPTQGHARFSDAPLPIPPAPLTGNETMVGFFPSGRGKYRVEETSDGLKVFLTDAIGARTGDTRNPLVELNRRNREFWGQPRGRG